MIAGGLALGVLSSSEAKSQTIDTPASIGRSIDSVAEVQYKKLLTHRDSVLEYNKQIEKMNANAERVGKKIEDFLKIHLTYRDNYARQEFVSPTNIGITKENKSITSSVSDYFSKNHMVNFFGHKNVFANKMYDKLIPVGEIGDIIPDFGKLNTSAPEFAEVRSFIDSFEDAKTKKHPDISTIKEIPSDVQFYSIFKKGVLSGKPDQWSFSADPAVRFTNEASYYVAASFFTPSGDNNGLPMNIPIKDIPSKYSTYLVNNSIEEVIKSSCEYNNIKASKINMHVYRVVAAEMLNPGSVLSINGVLTASTFFKGVTCVCVPVWEKKPIPKIPKKEKYIEEYKQKHQNEIPVSKKDIVLYTQKPVIDTRTKKPQTVPSSAINPESKDEFKSEESGYPVYGGPHRVYMGIVTESGKFIPTKDREHIDIPYFDEDRKILEKYDRGETDQDFDRILKEYGYKEKK